MTSVMRLLGALIVFSPIVGGYAQEPPVTIQITGPARCEDCLSVTLVRRLSLPANLPGPDRFSTAQLVGESMIAITLPEGKRGALVFDLPSDSAWHVSVDSYSGSSWARVQNAPDGALFLDPRGGRISLLAGGQLESRPPPAERYLQLPTGAVVLAGVNRSSELVGLPLHIWVPGSGIRSFGNPEREPFSASVAALFERNLAPSESGGFWAFPQRVYRAEEYSDSGALFRRWERRVDWFSVHEMRAGEPPPGWFSDLLQVSSGEVMTLVAIPDQEWQEGENRASDGGMLLPTVEGQHRWQDAVIEVLDPEQGVVLATLRHDLQFRGFLGPSMTYAVRENDDGIYIELWRVRFERHSNTQGEKR